MLDESYRTKTVPKEGFSTYSLTVVEGFKPVPISSKEEIRIEPFPDIDTCIRAYYLPKDRMSDSNNYLCVREVPGEAQHGPGAFQLARTFQAARYLTAGKPIHQGLDKDRVLCTRRQLAVFTVSQHGYFFVSTEIAHHEGCAALGESHHGQI
jgi:hypothetical protein